MRAMQSRASRTTLPSLQTLGTWLVILLCGLALLHFRFDWSVDGGLYARRAFLLSAYLLVIMLPTVYYLSLRLLHHRRAAIVLTAVVFLIFTVPYKSLGLDSLYYYATRPAYLPDTAFPPKLAFLPGGTLGTFPLWWLFMPLLFLFGTGCVWLVRWVRSRSGYLIGRRLPLLLTAAFAVICTQAFLHSGMRAPYSYAPVFEQVKSDHPDWHIVYRFTNGTGENNADQWVYTPLEQDFQGTRNPGDQMLVRRPFAFYLESQFGFFFNDYYCWLALNCLFWLAAVFAVGRFVTRITTPRVGLIAGALTVFGPGFIAFVATPAMYMQNYATAAIALCAFEDLIVDPPDGRQRQFALFTGLLALCALTYDLEPLFAVLFVYGVARRVPWKPLLASLVAALVLLFGFGQVVTHVLHIFVDPLNSAQIQQAETATKSVLFHPHISTWSNTFLSVVPKAIQEWFQAYFIIPALLALVGWRFLRDLSQKLLVGSMLLISLGMICVFYLGGVPIGTTPRIMYPYFVGVYLPAALALDAGSQWLSTALSPRIVAGRSLGNERLASYTYRLAPWAAVALMAFLANIDVFGHPTQYQEFLLNAGPVWLP